MSNTAWCTVRTISGQISQLLLHLIDEISNVAAEMNYYASLAEVDQEEIDNCELGLVGACLGSGLNHTNELHVMKYKEAMNKLNSQAWKWEVNNKHEQMI